MKVFLGVITTADSSLIGHDKNCITTLPRSTREVKNARRENDILLPVHVTAVRVDDAVTIQEQARPTVAHRHTPAKSSCARAKSSGIPMSMNCPSASK